MRSGDAMMRRISTAAVPVWLAVMAGSAFAQAAPKTTAQPQPARVTAPPTTATRPVASPATTPPPPPPPPPAPGPAPTPTSPPAAPPATNEPMLPGEKEALQGCKKLPPGKKFKLQLR